MKINALRKAFLLRKPSEYQEVYRRGKRKKCGNFSLIYLENSLSETRLGISVHGIRKATQRNRVKRVIREYYRLNRAEFPPAVDLVFAVRKDFRPESPREVGRVAGLIVKEIRSEFALSER